MFKDGATEKRHILVFFRVTFILTFVGVLLVMSGIENRKRIRCGIFLIVCFVLVGCATSGSYKANGKPVVDVMASLKSGEIRLKGNIGRSGPWGWNRGKAKKLHDSQSWKDLAITVTRVGYSQDLTYYYLGRSAEGLGYLDASKHYYNLAKHSNKCDGILNVCDGFVFPKMIDERLALLNKVNIEEKTSATKEAIDIKRGKYIKHNIMQERKDLELTEKAISDGLINIVGLVPGVSKKWQVEKIENENDNSFVVGGIALVCVDEYDAGTLSNLSCVTGEEYCSRDITRGKWHIVSNIEVHEILKKGFLKKFGQPEIDKYDKVRNGIGVEYLVNTVSWVDNKGNILVLTSRDGKINQGSLQLISSDRYKITSEKLKQAEESRRF